MKTFKSLRIVRNKRFSGTPPVEGALLIVGLTQDDCNGGPEVLRAGWLMPQVSEVDPKTARYYANRARYA